jgi:hypothetical protein
MLTLVTMILWGLVGFAALEAITDPASDQVSETTRRAMDLCLASGSLSLEEAVDNPVHSPCIPVSNLLDIDQAPKDKHPEGGIKTPAALCGRTYKSSVMQASLDKNI